MGMVLAQAPFPSVWDQADTLPVEMSTMSLELSLTPTTMILISAMMPVSLFWKKNPPTVLLNPLICHPALFPFLKVPVSSFPDGELPQKVDLCLPLSDKLKFHMSTMMTVLMLMDLEISSEMS